MHDNNSEFWQPYAHIVAHRRKIGALPPIRKYYLQPENQDAIRSFFVQAGVEGEELLEQPHVAVAEPARL